MAAKKSSRSARSRAAIGELGKVSSQVVQRAAAVLEEELAAGIVASKQVEARLRGEGKLDARDMESARERFRANGHELVSLAKTRFAELREPSSLELVDRFLTDAHDLLDNFVDFMGSAPDLVNRLAQAREAAGGKDGQPTPLKPRPNGPRPRPSRSKR